jgi:hypothetical protein
MTVASQVKQTLAGLKSATATLRLYSVQSQAEDAGAAFKEAALVTGAIIAEIENRIKVLENEEPQYKGL